ncbi:MAG: IS4 family transposase [Pleurocapsa sp. MO_226.B13]|nr:IS4 family transposase [Pleurocapsa sp. MO_226.B13]
MFKNASELKRTYEFLTNPKTSFEKIVESSHYQTAKRVKNLSVLLSIGDTTFLDYKKIKIKREEYGPIGNGGNGLILHSSLAVDPNCGQPLGLLWEKLWKRKHKITTKKKEKKGKGFEEKESYKWVEALKKVPEVLEKVSSNNDQKVIHVFDREGDISEVFEEVQKQSNCGVLIRASHNRAITEEEDYLWNYVQKQPLQFEQEIELPKNHQRKQRTATLAVKFCPVKLRAPQRLKATDSFDIHAVYAEEINPPEGEEPISWMLLTTEIVASKYDALRSLRWYTYRWLIEEYHKILKSGCQVENYRLAGNSMSVLLGFLTAIAADLLRITYLNRTQPDSSAESILTPVQIKVLTAVSSQRKTQNQGTTISGAITEIARLGGYLEHRRTTPIGITVLWRGWLELISLCQGWELRENL